jgi:hypothetical protein
MIDSVVIPSVDTVWLISSSSLAFAVLSSLLSAKAAQTESKAAQQVINNGDATEQDIANEKAKVEDKVIPVVLVT